MYVNLIKAHLKLFETETTVANSKINLLLFFIQFCGEMDLCGTNTSTKLNASLFIAASFPGFFLYARTRGKNPVQAGHVSSRFWEIIKILREGR